MMNTYRKAIKEILKFKTSFDKIGNPRVPRKLVGELGEYYVLWELERRGFSTIPEGGQSGCDIRLTGSGARIEVRTSLLKNEGLYPEGTRFYGWRVKNRNQKSVDKFDFLVGVALKDSFKNPKFYIFTHKEAFKVSDVRMGRFQNVQKKIAIFENSKAMKNAIRARPKYVTSYERFINKNQKDFLNKWGKIS